jgi:hypothetical protein
VRVALGTFARAGIEARLGSDVAAAGVQAALLHYTRRLRSGWTPTEFPRLFIYLADLERSSRRDQHPVTLL